MKTSTLAKLALATVIGAASMSATAKTEYHVYIKNGSCEIDMRTPSEWKKARGSSWQYIGKDSTRSGAKKIKDKAGC